VKKSLFNHRRERKPIPRWAGAVGRRDGFQYDWRMPESPPASAVTRISLAAEVPPALAGRRLDQIAASLFPDYSRARLQAWIRAGSLRVNGEQRRPRDALVAGDRLRVEAELAQEEGWQAQDMALAIAHEDAHLLVIDKTAGTVVHPAAGHHAGTLLNGLLHRYPQLAELPRAGIVHRLDKDTTGLMVVAKTLPAHTALVRQLQAREIGREYEAVVQGLLTGGGTVDAPLGRHPVNRKKRAVIDSGKEAVTHYRLLRRFACTWPTSVTHSWATRSMAAACSCRRAAVRRCARRCAAFSARRCMRPGSTSRIPSAARRWASPRSAPISPIPFPSILPFPTNSNTEPETIARVSVWTVSPTGIKTPRMRRHGVCRTGRLCGEEQRRASPDICGGL